MDDETTITDPTKIAEFFNNTLLNMLTKYLKNENRTIPEYDKLKTYIDSKVTSDAIFDIPPIEKEFVLKELKDLEKRLLEWMAYLPNCSNWQHQP